MSLVQTDVRGFYSVLGVRLPDRGGTHVDVSCFANPEEHKRGDKGPSCSVSLETGQWKCWGCGARGSAFDAAVALGYDRAGAARLAKEHDLFPTDRAQERPAADRRPAPNRSRLPSEAALAAWQHAALGERSDQLYASRGWTREAIEELGVGYDQHWKDRDGGPVVSPVRDADGELVGVCHYEPNPEERAGKKLKAAAGSRRGLFPAPEVLPADVTVYVVEGEGDAVAMRSLGLHTVAVPGAAGWKSEWAARFAQRHVVLLCDCDREGRKLAGEVADDLVSHAASVRVVDLDSSRDDGRDVGDVVREASNRGPGGLVQARALIEGMAGAADVLLPRPLESTAGLLADLAAFVRRFVVITDAQRVVIALWILHTHALDAADSTPYLAVTSAEKRSGKSRLLEVSPRARGNGVAHAQRVRRGAVPIRRRGHADTAV